MKLSDSTKSCSQRAGRLWFDIQKAHMLTMLLLILFLTFIPTVMYLLLCVLPLYLAGKRS